MYNDPVCIPKLIKSSGMKLTNVYINKTKKSAKTLFLQSRNIMKDLAVEFKLICIKILDVGITFTNKYYYGLIRS